MKILDGKALSLDFQARFALEVAELKQRGICPKLCVILVGENPASMSYVKMKQKACERTGIESKMIALPNDISEESLLKIIAENNADKSVSGILVQLPLPPHINTSAILEAIAAHKDVDGFHPYNLGRLYADCKLSAPILAPATPLGVMALLAHYEIPIKSQNVVIVGASNIVGKPLAALMLNAGASVSLCHIFTRDVSLYTRLADIVCVGVGKVNLLRGDMIKSGAVVVDIGINKVDGKIVGDAEFESVAEKASFITPVPGGVGPMTIAMLLQNTILCAKMAADSAESAGDSALDSTANPAHKG